MAMKTLEDLFLDELKDLFDAEKRLVKALPKMAKAADSDELREAIESHLEETTKHVARLEEAFGHLDKAAKGKTCKAMVGLLEEGSDLMAEDASPAVLDAGLICAAQKVEHYEIASYGTLRTWSELLGYEQITTLLDETLAEEKAADEKLTEIAGKLNVEAEAAEVDE